MKVLEEFVDSMLEACVFIFRVSVRSPIPAVAEQVNMQQNNTPYTIMLCWSRSALQKSWISLFLVCFYLHGYCASTSLVWWYLNNPLCPYFVYVFVSVLSCSSLLLHMHNPTFCNVGEWWNSLPSPVYSFHPGGQKVKMSLQKLSTSSISHMIFHHYSKACMKQNMHITSAARGFI